MTGRMNVERCCCPSEICAGCENGAPGAYEMVWTNLVTPAGPEPRFTSGNINGRAVILPFGLNSPPTQCYYESSPTFGTLITFPTDLPGNLFPVPLGTPVYMNYRIQITPTYITMRVDYNFDSIPQSGPFFNPVPDQIAFEASISKSPLGLWECMQAFTSDSVVKHRGPQGGLDIGNLGECTITPVT